MAVRVVGEVELRLVWEEEVEARFCCLASQVCMVGWPEMTRVQPPRRKMRRQGMMRAIIKSELVTSVR